MKKQYSYQEALQRMASLCSVSERCVSDIRQKLFDLGLSSVDCEKAVEYLKEKKFIDEARFSVAFAKDRFRFGKWGRIKISYALRQKNIPNDLIQESLQQIDEQEYEELLIDLLNAKKRSIKASSEYEQKAKLVRFAQSRGFETGLVFSILGRF